MNVEVNYLAVLLAGVSNMIAGFAWYSPFLFGKPWMKLMGLSKDSMKSSQKEVGKYYALSFVVALLSAYVLYHVMTFSKSYFGYPSLMTGITTGFWMWLGFVMPTQFTAMLFSGKKIDKDAWKLFGINTGYQFIALLFMGLTIGFMMG